LIALAVVSRTFSKTKSPSQLEGLLLKIYIINKSQAISSAVTLFLI